MITRDIRQALVTQYVVEVAIPSKEGYAIITLHCRNEHRLLVVLLLVL